MKYKSRKFILTIYFLFSYLLAEVFFLVRNSSIILEYLKILTPALVFIVLGYNGFNLIQKKIENGRGHNHNEGE